MNFSQVLELISSDTSSPQFRAFICARILEREAEFGGPSGNALIDYAHSLYSFAANKAEARQVAEDEVVEALPKTQKRSRYVNLIQACMKAPDPAIGPAEMATVLELLPARSFEQVVRDFENIPNDEDAFERHTYSNHFPNPDNPSDEVHPWVESKFKDIDKQLKELNAVTLATAIQAQMKKLRNVAQTADDYKRSLENSIDAFDTFQSKVDAVVEARVAEVASQKAIQFWDTRRSSHQTGFRFWVSVTVVWIVAMLVVIYSHIGGDAGPENWPKYVGGSFVLATLALFGVRFTTRLATSHLHLGDDAAERVTMLKSYILLAELGQVKDDDRRLMLNALFRPSVSGLVKDEATSNANDGLSQVLTAILAKSGSN